MQVGHFGIAESSPRVQNDAMWPVTLRPLLILIAVLAALTAPDADSARRDTARLSAALDSGPYSDPISTWLGLAVLNEPSSVSFSGIETSGSGPGGADVGGHDLLRPKRDELTRTASRRSAFAPGQLPPALAYLRLSGSANAGGTGTCRTAERRLVLRSRDAAGAFRVQTSPFARVKVRSRDRSRDLSSDRTVSRSSPRPVPLHRGPFVPAPSRRSIHHDPVLQLVLTSQRRLAHI